MFAGVIAAVGRFGGQVLLFGQRYAPQIMTYSGIGGFIATAFAAAKATTKAEKILQEKDEQLAAVQDAYNDPDNNYTAEDKERDEYEISCQTKWKLIKCYTPVVTLGMASTALILGGHHIIQARSASYAAAFKASEKAFRAYREAIARKYGEDPERLILDDKIPATNQLKDPHPIKRESGIMNNPLEVTPDAYLAWFSKDSSLEWVYNSPRMNWYKLGRSQDELNDQLRGKGYVFLNEARKKLGLPPTKEGQVLGWVLRKPREDGAYNDRVEGDNYIDFLHKDHPNSTVEALMRLEDVPVLLEFNCDGIILEEVEALAKQEANERFFRRGYGQRGLAW